MSNYFLYPFKNMRITQSYTGSYTHNPHSQGSPKDYPWDESGANSGREAFYCTCDGLRIVRIYKKGTNTIWVESTSKVDLPDGTKDYVCGSLTHPNDDDIKDLKVGQVFKRGDIVCYEGTDGNATGNHLHISFGKGRMKGTGWTQNSKGKWVLTTTGGACKPQDIFYLDKSFTRVLQDKGIDFKSVPDTKEVSESSKIYTTGNYKVATTLLHVRKGPGTQYATLSYANLTPSAKLKILAKVKYKANGYVAGMTFSVSEVKDNWGRTPSGWVCLDYCIKIK